MTTAPDPATAGAVAADPAPATAPVPRVRRHPRSAPKRPGGAKTLLGVAALVTGDAPAGDAPEAAVEAAPEPPQEAPELPPLPGGWHRGHPLIGAALEPCFPSLRKPLPDYGVPLLIFGEEMRSCFDDAKAAVRNQAAAFREATLRYADQVHGEFVHTGRHVDGDVCWYAAAYRGTAVPLEPLPEPARG